MKYRGFRRKSVCSMTRDTTPTTLTFLMDHVLIDTHRDTAADVAAPAVVNAHAVDARLTVRRPYHVRHAGRKIGFC